MDTYKESLYGKILWECYRSKIYIVLLSLVYVLLSTGAIVYLITYASEYDYFLMILTGITVMFSLWRINRVHNPVALVCEKKLLVSVPWSFLNSDYYISLRSFYMPIDYKEVAGVSNGWNRMYIGAKMTDGLVALPVQLAYVSFKDKLDLQDWIERMHMESPEID